MSQRLKHKGILLAAVAIVSMLVMGVLMATLQTNLALKSYTQEISQELDKLPALLESADSNVDQDTETYDDIYQSKVDSIGFMAANDAGYEATNAKMAEYQELLDVDNVLIVRRDGTVVARAADTKADFSHVRFARLFSVLDTGESAEPVEVELPDKDWLTRYYSARVSDDAVAIVEQDPTELRELTQVSGSTESVLKNITIGQDGYVFAVSSQDYVIEYHPDEDLTGADAIDAGLGADNLEDGAYGWVTLAGERLYCGVSEIDGMYYVAAVPERDMAASRNLTVGVILFIFFAVMALVILHGVFVLQDDEGRERDPEDYIEFERVRYNKAIGRKAAVFSFVGFLVTVCIAFYMQSLFALSSESVTNNERVADIEETVANAGERADVLSEQYSERYLNKARTAAYILDANPALATREDLQRLADVLQIQYLFTFNGQGVMTATNSSYANFTLSEDPADQSYPFRRLLQGADSYVQEPMADEISGQMRQYIGVPLHDEDGEVEGLVQLGIRPTRLENLLATTQIDVVLQNVKVGSDGFAFAVSKEDGTLAYYPDSRLQGKAATDVGMMDKQVKSGFCDYLTIDGTQYYASSGETDDYYVYVAGSEGELMAERVPLTGATAVVALICQACIFVLLTFERKYESKRARRTAGAAGGGAGDGAADAADADEICAPGEGDAEGEPAPAQSAADDAEAEAPADAEEDSSSYGMRMRGAAAVAAGTTADEDEPDEEDSRMIDVEMPSGRTVRTESAASRWLARSFKWGEKTPEQKTLTVMRWLLGVFVLLVCIAVLFRDRVFGEDSLFSYILGGGWDYGVNVFAITAAIMFVCVAMTIVTVVQKILQLLASAMGARGETVCRLLSSFIKYATIIGLVYYTLLLIGIDGTTLLASAGILSIAISLGAKELVADILSGLFIIFEGEFRVGDIITVGSWRGTVVSIGVRSTKVDDGGGNVKVIRNSEMSNVVNMTKQLSYASCDVGIEYSESLERVENILSKELPFMRMRLDAIVDGPFYKGVVALEDSSVVIRVVAQCTEGDRGQLERDLNREVKLLFDAYDISMPFPQIVVNQPSVRKVATEAEKRAADAFHEEQKHASKDIGNEDADDDNNER